MKLIFNIGWVFTDHLYYIAQRVIEAREVIPPSLEIEHVVWAEICKSYWNTNNTVFIHFINARDKDKTKLIKKL